ncbi:MAG: aminotransferase class III-fold pyridoxal phosphate-dependent enzyme [Alphaproteobacteria bacterium]|nr:aminotransferase class III-fold pyridoxal phosphate-dependent enzyme [Alphaproteobacteria bacterium]
MSTSTDLYDKARGLIPGGTQLLSKRPEMFLPGRWPSYYRAAKGCEVEDLDGRRYFDMSYMGIGSCTLGYADPDVNEAVASALANGAMTTLNAPEEVWLAEKLCALHPWAGMVRYTRSGGEAMSVAVRIARAHTRRDVVLFCGYHGWHDWYLSANLADDAALDGHLIPGLDPAGVPRGLKGSAIPFHFNDADALRRVAREHGERAGVLVLEAIRSDDPTPEFLEAVREVRETYGLVLVVDEITSGFRLTTGGAHLLYDGLDPDIAVFAKGMSNGIPMAAVLGTRAVMDSAQASFISSTYWTDRLGPAAALATIAKFESHDVPARLRAAGNKVMAGWSGLAENHGLHVHVGGMEPLGHFGFDESPLVLKTLFTQEMLDEGYLATTAFYASYAHTDAIIHEYLAACDRTFAKIAAAVASGDPQSALRGPVCHSGFKRLTS